LTIVGDPSAIHSDRRLPSITGLRLFAALAVYLSHIGAPHEAPTALATFFASGYAGVTVFFVLSGFVLAYNYFEQVRRPDAATIYNFFVARFARVYPLYLAVLAYVLVRQHALGIGTDEWWQHLLALQAWNGDVNVAYAFNGPAWSISVEFFLYACFPLLIPLVAKLDSPRRLLLAGAAVALTMATLAAWFVTTGHAALPTTDPGSAHRWIYRMPLPRLGDFLLGILAARLFVHVVGRPGVRQTGRWLAPLAGAAIVALMAWPALRSTAWSYDLAYGLPAVLLIFALAAAPAGWLSRGLSIPAVVLLGEASYAFYLVHSPAIAFLGAGQWREAVSGSLVALEVFNLAVILALAVGLHLSLERPARRWLRRKFSYRNGSRRAAASPEAPAPQTAS
jgi:peptidoglycan/LPS O-acetylase OafA/YrhL